MYKVGLIGLGRIAAGYSGPDDPLPYTHAGGISRSRKVELAAVADLAPEAREAFRARWGRCFPDLAFYPGAGEMLAAGGLDIVAVCTPGPRHHDAVMEAIGAGPKVIFLEKPPSCSLAEMDAMTAAARAAGVTITVSYSRHWGPHVLWMARLISGGLIGRVRGVTGYCGGRFLSFSSHTADMICQFAGYCPTAVYARGAVPPGAAPAGYEAEPELRSMIIEFANGVTGTQVGFPGEHGSFYCEVAGEAGWARVPFYGEPCARDGDGAPLDLTGHGRPEPASPFKVAYEQIAAFLDGGPAPECSGGDFAAVHEIGFAGIESVLTGRRVELPNANRARRIFADG